MNRTRPPRRAATLCSRSRESSPERQVESSAQEPPSEEEPTAVPLPPRRCTRNRRGTPTPQLETSADANNENTNASDDQGRTQAQHAKNETSTAETSNDRGSTYLSKESAELVESKSSENARAMTESPSTSQEETKTKTDSPTPKGITTDNGEPSREEIPTVSQESNAAKEDDNGDGHASGGVSTLPEVLPQPSVTEQASSSSHSANGPGDDHGATKGNEIIGDRAGSTGDEHGGSKTHVNKATDAGSSPTLLDEGLNAEKGVIEADGRIPNGDSDNSISNVSQTEAVSASSEALAVQQPAIRSESRTISLGSKSALEAVEGGGNDHDESTKASGSAQVSLDSQNESQDQRTDPTEKDGASKVEATSSNGTERKKETSPLTGDEKRAEAEDVDNTAAVSDAKAPARGNESHSGVTPQETMETSSTSDVRGPISASPGDTPMNGDASRESVSSARGEESEMGARDRTSANCDEGVSETDETAILEVAEESRNRDSTPAREEGKPDSSVSSSLPVSNAAVVSNTFAIDIRPTTKNSSKVRRLVGATPETAPSGVGVGTVLSQPNEKPARVKDSVSTASGKHKLSDDRIDGVESTSFDGPTEPNNKRQRKEVVPTAITSSAVEGLRRRRGGPRKRTNRQAPCEVLSGLSEIESVKTRLYDIASNVHRGKSPERRFVAYWEALSKFLSFQVVQGVNAVDQAKLRGIHEELDSFLITKQMRKLHNRLIMALLSQCSKESIGQSGLGDSIPDAWRDRLRKQSVASHPTAKNVSDSTLVAASETDATLDLTDFDLLSDLWTATGREPLISPSCGGTEVNNALISKREVAEIHRHSPCLPGALAVDPKVRAIVREESNLKVSETAIWLLIVSVREYARSLLKDTVSNIASVGTEHALEAINFSAPAIHSGNMNGAEKKKAATNDKRSLPTEKTGVSGRKTPSATGTKRRITPLDIAAGLTRSRLSSRETFSGSVSGVAYERCCHVPLGGNYHSSPGAFDSVQSFVVDSMESVAKKPRHEWHDPAPYVPPVAPIAPVAPKAKKEPPRKLSTTVGLGEEATDLAALKARAAAAAVVANANAVRASPQVATVAPQASPAAAPPTPPAATGQARPQECNVTPLATTGVAGPAGSPRGRGKGFGIKDLSAMRARSTPPKQTGTSPVAPSPPQQQASEAKPPNSAIQQQPVTQVQQNCGVGKELRRLQEAEARKGNSPPETKMSSPGTQANATDAASLASPANKTAGIPPRALAVTHEPNGMDTT